MRTKEEIIKDMDRTIKFTPDTYYQAYIIELLLDIRELLEE